MALQPFVSTQSWCQSIFNENGGRRSTIFKTKADAQVQTLQLKNGSQNMGKNWTRVNPEPRVYRWKSWLQRGNQFQNISFKTFETGFGILIGIWKQHSAFILGSELDFVWKSYTIFARDSIFWTTNRKIMWHTIWRDT